MTRRGLLAPPERPVDAASASPTVLHLLPGVTGFLEPKAPSRSLLRLPGHVAGGLLFSTHRRHESRLKRQQPASIGTTCQRPPALRLGCANFAAPQRNRPLRCPAPRNEDSAALRRKDSSWARVIFSCFIFCPLSRFRLCVPHLLFVRLPDQAHHIWQLFRLA